MEMETEIAEESVVEEQSSSEESDDDSQTEILSEGEESESSIEQDDIIPSSVPSTDQEPTATAATAGTTETATVQEKKPVDPFAFFTLAGNARRKRNKPTTATPNDVAETSISTNLSINNLPNSKANTTAKAHDTPSPTEDIPKQHTPSSPTSTKTPMPSSLPTRPDHTTTAAATSISFIKLALQDNDFDAYCCGVKMMQRRQNNTVIRKAFSLLGKKVSTNLTTEQLEQLRLSNVLDLLISVLEKTSTKNNTNTEQQENKLLIVDTIAALWSLCMKDHRIATQIVMENNRGIVDILLTCLKNPNAEADVVQWCFGLLSVLTKSSSLNGGVQSKVVMASNGVEIIMAALTKWGYEQVEIARWGSLFCFSLVHDNAKAKMDTAETNTTSTSTSVAALEAVDTSKEKKHRLAIKKQLLHAECSQLLESIRDAHQNMKKDDVALMNTLNAAIRALEL